MRCRKAVAAASLLAWATGSFAQSLPALRGTDTKPADCSIRKLGPPPSSGQKLKYWLTEVFALDSDFADYSVVPRDTRWLQAYLRKFPDAIGWQGPGVLGILDPVGSWRQMSNLDAFAKGMARGMGKSCRENGGIIDGEKNLGNDTSVPLRGFTGRGASLTCQMGNRSARFIAFVMKGWNAKAGHMLFITSENANLADKALDRFINVFAYAFPSFTMNLLCGYKSNITYAGSPSLM